MEDPWARPIGDKKEGVEQTTVHHQEMSEDLTFFEKIINIIVHPKDFFEWLHDNHSTKDAVKYLLLLGYIVSGVFFIIGLIGAFFLGMFIKSILPSAVSSYGAYILIGIVFGFAALYPLFLLVANFIGGGFMHIFVLLFKGREYSKTFSVLAYAVTPSLLSLVLFPIPILGQILVGIVGIWAIVLSFYGLMKVYDFPFWKVLAIYIIVILLPVVISFVLSAMFLGGIMSLLL